MIIYKNKVFELFLVFSVIWTLATVPQFIFCLIFGDF